MRRVYVPSTLPGLARLHDEGSIEAGFVAHAVTPALREWYAESDTEELEHAAFVEAERGSLRQLAADPGARRLRVVVSADVPEDAVAPVLAGVDEDDRGAVLVRAAVPLSAVASVHVDEAEAEADVAAAVDALDGAASGDDDAQFAVDGAEGHELLWYDVTELSDVLTQGGH